MSKNKGAEIQGPHSCHAEPELCSFVERRGSYLPSQAQSQAAGSDHLEQPQTKAKVLLLSVRNYLQVLHY